MAVFCFRSCGCSWWLTADIILPDYIDDPYSPWIQMRPIILSMLAFLIIGALIFYSEPKPKTVESFAYTSQIPKNDSTGFHELDMDLTGASMSLSHLSKHAADQLHSAAAISNVNTAETETHAALNVVETSEHGEGVIGGYIHSAIVSPLVLEHIESAVKNLQMADNNIFKVQETVLPLDKKQLARTHIQAALQAALQAQKFIQADCKVYGGNNCSSPHH